MACALSGSPMTNFSITSGSCCSFRTSPHRPWCLWGSHSSTFPTSSPHCMLSGCLARRSDWLLLTHPEEPTGLTCQHNTWYAKVFREVPHGSFPQPASWTTIGQGQDWADWEHFGRELLWLNCQRPTRHFPWEYPLRQIGPYHWQGSACRTFWTKLAFVDL